MDRVEKFTLQDAKDLEGYYSIKDSCNYDTRYTIVAGFYVKKAEQDDQFGVFRNDCNGQGVFLCARDSFEKADDRAYEAAKAYCQRRVDNFNKVGSAIFEDETERAKEGELARAV